MSVNTAPAQERFEIDNGAVEIRVDGDAVTLWDLTDDEPVLVETHAGGIAAVRHLIAEHGTPDELHAFDWRGAL